MNIQIQQQIKNNAQDIKTYVSDLYSWEQQMNVKQKAKNKIKKENAQQDKQRQQREKQQYNKKKQQQRLKQVKQAAQQQAKRKQDLKRDVNTVQDYYNAWNSYDIDSQLKRLEQQEKRSYQPYNPYDNAKNNIRAKPKAAMNIKGGRKVVKDPTSLKDKANVYYKACDYNKAIQCYTQCIQKLDAQELQENITEKTKEENMKLKALVLSNRAMTYVKINERAKALQDCNRSIQNDPKYSKSYLRRADCLKKIGKYKEALQDYYTIRKLTPQDKAIETDIKNLQKFLQKRVKQAQQSLVVKNYPGVIPDSYRIQINEVDQFSEQILGVQAVSKEKQTNYLQEL